MSEFDLLLRDYVVTLMVTLGCCFAVGLVNVIFRRYAGHNMWRAPVEEERFLTWRLETDLEDDEEEWQ